MTDFDLNMLQASHKIFVLHVKILRDLTKRNGIQFPQEAVCDADKPAQQLVIKAAPITIYFTVYWQYVLKEWHIIQR